MAETASAPHSGPDTRHHGEGKTTSWIVGVGLIVLGVAFLLEQSGYIVLTGNWWAVFIYAAAIASFANAWRSYRATGEFGATATGSLVWGLVFTVVATIFLFNLLWDTWWPAILIAVGVGIVAGYLLRSQGSGPRDESDSQASG
jgi:drug/metabolite transporter (DMT)-like permease